MRGNAVGIIASPPPLPSRSRMKRPDWTPHTGDITRHSVPGFYQSSRWDAGHPIPKPIGLYPRHASHPSFAVIAKTTVKNTGRIRPAPWRITSPEPSRAPINCPPIIAPAAAKWTEP